MESPHLDSPCFDSQAKELYKSKLKGESISALARKYGIGIPTSSSYIRTYHERNY